MVRSRYLLIVARAFLAKLANCAAVTAPINSSLGNVSFFSGATRVLATRIDDCGPLRRYATAPYAFVLASQNTCSSGVSLLVDTVIGRLGKTIVPATVSISLAMLNHLSLNSCESGSSHWILCCQSSCINNLARMVTGDNRPCGSYIFEELLRTSLFVGLLDAQGVTKDFCFWTVGCPSSKVEVARSHNGSSGLVVVNDVNF